MKRKILGLAIIGLGLSISSFAQSRKMDPLIQNKYPGLAGAHADVLVVDKRSVTLSPITGNKTRVSGAEGLRYVIVPNESYAAELKRYPGFVGKPANHIQIRGQETVVLKTSEVKLKTKKGQSFLLYPGFVNKPANHISIDGIHTILVPRSNYLDFMKRQVGVADLPGNYVQIDRRTVQVIPVDDKEYSPLFATVNPQSVIEGSTKITCPDCQINPRISLKTQKKGVSKKVGSGVAAPAKRTTSATRQAK